ncbi:MAG: hypothetical protein M3Y87_04115 [Myxococcota bacterium]|nr:hypothetical protein [Myxococcota bacterium]
MGSREKLGEIDRELESFGKDDETLAAVLRVARERAPSGLQAVDEALAELGVVGRAVAPAVPRREEARVRTVPPEGASAKPATWEREARVEPIPDDASGLVELPEELLRAEALPPVLELDAEIPAEIVPSASSKSASSKSASSKSVMRRAASAPEPEPFEDTTDIRDPNSLEDELLAQDDLAPTGEIALSIDEPSSAPTREEGTLADLFDDAPEAEPIAADGSGGLADLFDDPDGSRPEAEPGAHEDLSDLLGAELQSALDGSEPLESMRAAALPLEEEAEPEHTVIFASDEMRAMRNSSAPSPAASALDAQLDALVGEPLAVEPAEMPHSGDFELMIDEDVLVLDDAELEQGETSAAPSDEGSDRPPATSPSQAPQGFFSRILNRK